MVVLTVMRWLCLWFLINLSYTLSGQLSVWQLVHVDAGSGLPAERINWITEDSLGFLWIAADNGLYRFDGTQYTPVDLTDHAGRTVNGGLSELYLDRHRQLWIATMSDGLVRYRPHTAETILYPPDLSKPNAIPAGRTYNLFEDHAHQLWFSAHGEGLCRYDPEHDHFTRVQPYQDEAGLRKHKDFQHMISHATRSVLDSNLYWMASLHGLVRWDVVNDTYDYVNPTEIVGFRSIHQIQNGTIWGVTWGNGLWSYDPSTDKWEQFRCAPGPNTAFNCLNASDVTQLDAHTLLIASVSGLVSFDLRTQTFDTSRIDMPPHRPHRFFHDSRKQIWIMTNDDGLYLFQPARQKFRRLFSASDIRHVIVHPDEDIMFAAGTDTLFELNFDGQLISTLTYEGFLRPEEHFIADIFFDADDQLWVLDGYGLYYLTDDKRLRPFDHPGQQQLIANGYYWCGIPDRQDVCWMMSQGTGVWTVDLNTGDMENHDFVEGNPGSLVHNYSIGAGFLDRDGDVWGSASSGVFYFDQRRGVFVNSDAQLLASDSITLGAPSVFAQDANGTIWCGRFLNRIGRIEKGQLNNQPAMLVDVFTQLPKVRIRDMCFDTEGNLWVASEGGLCRYDIRHGATHLYDVTFGLGDVTSLSIRKDGKLIAAVDGGVVMVDPTDLPAKSTKPKPIITSFRIFDKPYQSGEGTQVPYIREASLSHTQNFFSFDFGAIDFTNPEQKQYAYKLEGLDPDWNYPEAGRQYAAYTNVGGGRFVFRVKARNPGTDWGEEEATVVVRVIPPVWQSPWFIVSGIILLALVIWFLYNYRIGEIKKKESLITAFNKQLAETEMKALRAQMNPHFLFNTLNAVKLYVQKNDQEKAVEYLTSFAKLIRQVLQNSGKTFIPLSAELEALELYIQIERMRFDAMFEYNIRVGEDVSPESVRIPPLLLQPYVENAIWHGLMHKSDGHGLLQVEITREGDDLYCVIEDNGIGREAAQHIRSKSAEKKKSMGMQITRDRMDMSGRMSDIRFDVSIHDLRNHDDTAAGTRVVLHISPKATTADLAT